MSLSNQLRQPPILPDTLNSTTLESTRLETPESFDSATKPNFSYYSLSPQLDLYRNNNTSKSIVFILLEITVFCHQSPSKPKASITQDSFHLVISMIHPLYLLIVLSPSCFYYLHPQCSYRGGVPTLADRDRALPIHTPALPDPGLAFTLPSDPRSLIHFLHFLSIPLQDSRVNVLLGNISFDLASYPRGS